jgi:hypothetical protein
MTMSRSETSAEHTEVRDVSRMSKREARETPHEFAVPANPYKSALICAYCGLGRGAEIHAPEVGFVAGGWTL